MDKTIARLVALFAVISIGGIAFVGFRYVGAGDLVGLGPDTVRMQMTESGGIFPDAAVSYRGVEVGKVGDMRVTPTGLEIELLINRTAPDIPNNGVAVVANRSAVGEQYVDLQPTRDGAPFLQDGDVIPASRTRTPVPVDSLLADVNALATSVPLPELRGTVDELYNAFNRTGPQLQRLIDASNPLVRSAIANLPQTAQLLADGRTVLTTQAQLGGPITSFSRDLRLFTAQLKADDPNLRRLLRAAPPAATQLEGLIRDVGPDLSRTLFNLLTITSIVAPRLDGLEQVLVTYPVLSAGAPAVVPGDGTVHFGLVLNFNDPPPCRAGYLPTSEWLPANANLDNSLPLDTNLRCNEAPPINVRGSQNNPNRGIGGFSVPTPSSPGTNPVVSPLQNQRQSTSMNPVQASGVLADSGRAPAVIIPGMSP
jgi:phospholipid/cholesterol/gamma-HCH transport system substrate-binding protein